MATTTAKTVTADDVLRIAKAELGNTDGTKYGKWYKNNVDGSDCFDAPGIPWCAMNTSWVFDKAGVKCAGLPGAYCPTMLAKAENAGKAVAAKNCKSGYVVYFDWDGGEADHVGICVENHPESSCMDTIEGNTDEGVVRIKRRYYSNIVGCVKPEYGAAASKEKASTDEKPTATKSVEEVAKEVIAGQWGNGDERRERLAAAGHDYAKVQAKVNELLGHLSGYGYCAKRLQSFKRECVRIVDYLSVYGTFDGYIQGYSERFGVKLSRPGFQ
jgi:hypothetical protein